MELGLTFPLQRFLKIKAPDCGTQPDRRFCWDLHVIELRGRKCLLAVHWNSQENRTPMSKTLSGKRVISEASPFDQWREIQFIGSVAPAAVVVGLDPAEYDLANLIPLHGGALEPVDQFLLQRCESLGAISSITANIFLTTKRVRIGSVNIFSQFGLQTLS